MSGDGGEVKRKIGEHGKEQGMGRLLCRKNIIYDVAALLLFLAVFLVTFPRERKDPAEQAEIVVFGDSVFALIRDETAVPALLQELLDRPVYNAALGGTGMAKKEISEGMDRAKDALSFVGLAKAAGAEDFGVQQASRIRESNTEYFPEVIDGLKAVDFSQVEIVLIQQGVNDYHAAVPIDNPEDPYDEFTFLGALRSGVNCLRQAYPEIRIVLITPTYSWYKYTGLTCEEADQGGGLLEAYVEAEIREAEKLGIEVIDVYHDFYPHERWEDWELYTWDGIHPNEEGRMKLAQRIAEFLSQP